MAALLHARVSIIQIRNARCNVAITSAPPSAAYQTLDRAGALEHPANHSRPLKEAQRLRAEQLAANGDVLGGIVEYAKGRISEEAADEVAFTLAVPLAFITDPDMRPILEEACLFCWEAYRKDYSPSADRRAFLHDYCSVRFITVALLTPLGRNASERREMQCGQGSSDRSAMKKSNRPRHS